MDLGLEARVYRVLKRCIRLLILLTSSCPQSASGLSRRLRRWADTFQHSDSIVRASATGSARHPLPRPLLLHTERMGPQGLGRKSGLCAHHPYQRHASPRPQLRLSSLRQWSQPTFQALRRALYSTPSPWQKATKPRYRPDTCSSVSQE
jgi:hypothetical protein